jgi:two-component system, chemotaxis family, CheB/CheR fusion protein
MSDAGESKDFEPLLDYLRRTRGFEFTAYKRPSLMRRIQKRMQMVGIEGFADYMDYLEVHPDEFAQLFDYILINVTGFFRDESAWDLLRDEVIPKVIGEPESKHIVRIWSAGCASGEETYSIAMLLAEALGRDAFRDRVKIYATDVDDHALGQARAATYTERQVQPVPPLLLDRYFVRDNDRFVFDKDLRRSVIFGRHDLIQDAPISRVNILLCRNTLMYFNTEAQNRILARFHFALVPEGVLFLGKAEMLFTYSQLFAPIDLRRRLFRKIAKDGWRERMAIVNRATDDDVNGQNGLMYSAILDASPHAQIAIDNGGTLAMFNERARSIFNIVPSDVGRPIQDLEMSYRPVELRSLIDQAGRERRTVTVKDVEWQILGREPRFFDVAIVPLTDGGGRALGMSISFNDVSRAQDLQVQLNRARHDLDTAYEELQSTNEELETTNEELQSTVEELETTNEELQSTNEELETMNEELQSSNEELQTINEELRQRSDDLNRSNGFLESILTGLRSGVVVLDRELHVIAWNPRAEDLWGLRADEVRAQNFLNLDIGLPTDQLRAGIRSCLNGDGEHMEQVVPATNRRGRTITCRITATPLTGGNKEVRGVILLMDEQGSGSPIVH